MPQVVALSPSILTNAVSQCTFLILGVPCTFIPLLVRSINETYYGLSVLNLKSTVDPGKGGSFITTLSIPEKDVLPKSRFGTPTI